MQRSSIWPSPGTVGTTTNHDMSGMVPTSIASSNAASAKSRSSNPSSTAPSPRRRVCSPSVSWNTPLSPSTPSTQCQRSDTCSSDGVSVSPSRATRETLDKSMSPPKKSSTEVEADPDAAAAAGSAP